MLMLCFIAMCKNAALQLFIYSGFLVLLSCSLICNHTSITHTHAHTQAQTYINKHTHTNTHNHAPFPSTLCSYTCLTTGDVFPVNYNNKIFEFEVKETKPGAAISVVETDCEVSAKKIVISGI